ncbi:hypothetical protein B0O80DRAFT_456368, partial [Mortierella sp. GBAus27b]
MKSELILYLEPTRSSTLWTQLDDFFNFSRGQPWSGNQALRYPPHTTMVGFFDDPTATSTGAGAAQEPPVTDQMIQFLTQKIHEMTSVSAAATAVPTAASSAPRSTMAQVQGLIRPQQDSVLIAVQPSPLLLKLMKSLKDKFPELGIHLKPINHISLCYWDGDGTQPVQSSDPTPMQAIRTQWADQAAALALDRIQALSSQGMEHDNGFWNESWDIVLYSIHNRDRSNGLPYPLDAIHRWTL